MKAVFTLLFLFALASAFQLALASLKTQDLKERNAASFDDLLQQAIAFIPMDDEVKVYMNYLESDKDVQLAVLYLYSDFFASLVNKVEYTSLWIQFLRFLYDSGVEKIYTYINRIHKIFDLPPYVPPPSPLKRVFKDPGVLRMINEMLRLLPREDILKWFDEVCNPDPIFQTFLQRIRSPEFEQLKNDILASPEYIEFKATLLQNGIDIDALENAIINYVTNGKID